MERIWNLKRGGADLAAESESLFSKEVFILHPKDTEMLKTLAEIKEPPFLMMLIGIPGVGKTGLLLTLLRDEADVPESVRDNSLWKAVRKKYNFLDLSHPIASSGRRDAKRNNVWIVPTVDEYNSPSSGGRMAGLLSDMNKTMKQNDSIIVAGNLGMFATTVGDRDPRLKIYDVVTQKAAKAKSRTPALPTKIVIEPWIKEYGGDPADDGSIEVFKEFSAKTISFVSENLAKCSEENCTVQNKERCRRFISTLNETLGMLKEGDFARRLHDLLCGVRLVHRDIFFTPRTLLVFWADYASNLLERLTSDEKGIIYESAYESCLISSLYSQSYKLHETNLDVFRSKEIDRILSEKYSGSIQNQRSRRSSRLQIYFEGSIGEPRKMIYDGAYADFIDQQNSSEVLKRVFRYFFVYADRRFQKKLIALEQTVRSEEWLLYTFLTECWKKKKREFITNVVAIDRFIDKYTPVKTDPIDFKKARSRTVFLNLKDSQRQKPHFDVDLETFLPFRMLDQGFYVDFSTYPSILAKIEIVLSELRDIFRPHLLEWLDQHVSDKDAMSYTYLSEEGLLSRTQDRILKGETGN